MKALACALILVLGVGIAAAQPAVDPAAALPSPPPGKIVVGTVPVAPFIVKNADGSWGGISMDLWKEVARRLKLDYEVRELAPADLQDPAKLAQVDVKLGSPLRKAIDLALLQFTATEDWSAVLARYLGVT